LGAAGNPIKMSDLDDMTSAKAAPLLDKNRQEILSWLLKKESENNT
jgi:hypothetical protein